MDIFLEPIARMLDLGGLWDNPQKPAENPIKANEDALRKDWERVFGDFNKVMLGSHNRLIK